MDIRKFFKKPRLENYEIPTYQMSSSQSSSKSSSSKSSSASSASSSQSSSKDHKQPSKDRQNVGNKFKLDKGRGFTSSNSITLTDVSFAMTFNLADTRAPQPKKTPPSANVPTTKGNDVKSMSPKPSNHQN
ncbi:hypothetical protein QTP88_000542 [Uroleucon formosanum]